MFRPGYAYFILVLVLIMMGCSSSSVVTPDNHNPISQADISSMPVWISDYNENNNPAGGLGTLGLFDIHIDTATLTGEMTLLRSSLSADVLEVVDITNFLRMAPCYDCAGIRGIEINADGNLVVKIGILHPFEAGDPLKPISGRNRADLHVFNVEGIVVSDGTGVNSFASLGVTTGGFSLLNADGYTGYLDSAIDEIFPTDADIHPFITHFADYTQGTFDASNLMGFESVTDPPPSGNLVMAMGCDEDIRDYEFDLAGGDINFIFAIGCTYAVSADNKSLRFMPEYRIPQHNKKSASYVNVVIDSNDLSGGDTASEAQLTIEVLDINHGIAVGTNLDEMRSDSSVSEIEIEIPSVTSTPVTFPIVPTGGDGRDPANPLTFTGTIQNSSGADEGTYTGLVKITDSYSTGLNELLILNGMDGIKRVDPIDNPLSGLFEIAEFATYQTFEISVASGNDDPVAVLLPDPANGCNGAGIWFDGAASYDTDGTIETYEFDFDYDGVDFFADVSGLDSRVLSSLYTTGNYTAALRVYDNLGAWNIDTVDVNIAVGGSFDVDPYETKYVTDTSFSDVIFTPNGFSPDDGYPVIYGVEAMATGSEYIFAVFYANGTSGEGVYLARSGDDGATWGNYNLVHAMTTGAAYSGAAIYVIGTEVFIVIGETSPRNLVITYNGNNGEGSFTEHQISSSVSERSMSVAVDPSDTDNIYVCAANGVGSLAHFVLVYVFVSNTGLSGPYTEHQIATPLRGTFQTQAYTAEMKVAPDMDVYLFIAGNRMLALHKSDNFGLNFTEIYAIPELGWNNRPRDADCCFDPSNPELIHWVFMHRTQTGPYSFNYWHEYRRSIDGGVTWGVIDNNLHDSNLGYTNCAVCTDAEGNVYFAYTDDSIGNGEVYGRFSDDQGLTLGPVIQISENDPGNDGHVEITPTTNGCDVVIGWLEDRDGARRVVSRRG